MRPVTIYDYAERELSLFRQIVRCRLYIQQRPYFD